MAVVCCFETLRVPKLCACVSRLHINEESRFIPRGVSVWDMEICLISSRWRTYFFASPDFSTAIRTSSSKVLRYSWVTFLVKNVETIFLETVRQSASCLPDVVCPRAFNARNIIDDVIWRAREMHCDLNLSSWWWNWGWLVNVRTYRTALCRQMFFQAELTLLSTVLAHVRGTQVPLTHLSDSNTHYIITTRSRASSGKRAHQCVPRTNHTPSKRRALSRQHGTDMCGPISSTKLCFLHNAIYEITCNNCNQHYIGSTTHGVQIFESHDQLCI